MVEEKITPKRNVVSLRDYRRARTADRVAAPRLCRHCHAVLMDGEFEDECSGARFSAEEVRAMRQPRRRMT